MKSLTIQLTDRQDKLPGFEVVLREGDPTQAGTELERELLPALTADQQKSIDGLRDAMLTQTGRIGALDARGAEVGRLMLPGTVGVRWLALRDQDAAEVAEWILDHETIVADPREKEDRKAWARVQPGYRTYLHVTATGLDSVPWEFARIRGDAVFLLGDAPFSRFTIPPGARIQPRPGWQIRILAVVAAENASSIQANEEIRAIRSELRRLDRIYDLDIIAAPTRTALVTKLQTFKPNVLHFIGHGSGDHLDLFDGTTNQPWGATQIAADIGPKSWIPEVVYLNACRSQGDAAASAGDQDRQRTIVDALLARQVLAVVAMQADIRGSAAGAGAAAFYGSLLDYSPIDVATANGRARISRIPGRDGARDPFLPVLTLTVPADTVLRHRASTADPAAPLVSERLLKFVDRVEDRRSIVAAFETRTRKNVIVLRGAQDIGKSWLLCWSIDMCLRRRYHVRYVELGACTDWLHVLRTLRDGGKLARIQAPLGPLLKPTFNWRLSNLARGIVQPPGTAAADEKDTAGPLKDIEAAKLQPPTFGTLVCAAFHEALDLGDDGQLVLVFDQIEAGDGGLGSAQFALLREYLINPLIARGDGRVAVLLAIRSERQKDYELETLPPDYGKADMPLFSSQDSRELLRDLFLLRLADQPEATRKEAAMITQMEEELARYPAISCNGRRLEAISNVLWESCELKVSGLPGLV